MSHFSVMVFGPDVDDQLAPYDEDGEWFREADEERPESKWDWWVIGGRWTGYFKLKPEADQEFCATGEPGLMTAPAKAGHADQCLKGDVDIDGMRDAAGEKAGAEWDSFWSVAKDTPRNTPWSDFVDRVKAEEITWDEARAQYGAQPRVRALREHDEQCRRNKDFNAEILSLFGGPEDFAETRDEHVQNARDAALAPYAFVRDGKWVGRGEMGWWGMASDEADRGAWSRAFNEMWDSLPDDTLVTLVDCHV